MPPTTPYCTPDQVAFLVKSLLSPNTKFNTGTSPSVDNAEEAIELISAQVEQQFRTAGYIIPFLPLPQEEWPTSQTVYLRMITSLGSAAYVGGHILAPLPIRQGKSSGGENSLQGLYMQELERIYRYDRVLGTEKATSRFRAMAYNNTPAQRSIAEPIGPISEAAYLQRQDPTRSYTMKILGDLFFDLKGLFEQYGASWRYAVEVLKIEPWLTA